MHLTVIKIEVQFRNNVKNIGARAFQGTSLAVVCFGSGIEEIGDKAFADCCINTVFINNENMYRNFNSRYDFGEVAITANNVMIYEELVGDNDDEEGIAGDYLAASEFYNNVREATSGAKTVASYRYKRSNYIDYTGFMPVYGIAIPYSYTEYNPQTNVLDCSFWEDSELREGRDIVYYDNMDDTSGVDIDYNRIATPKPSEGTTVKSTEKPKKTTSPTKQPETKKDCMVCGGDGKKECTSCHGTGKITEYESGQYMGYGSATREVKKDCPVCTNGQVKCLSCA